MIDSPESDVWIAVIGQALSDATLGLGVFKQGSRKTRQVNCYLRQYEIREAREFISGRDGSLKNICDALNMDYEETRLQLLTVYKDCLPLLPVKWQQEIKI